MNTQYRLYSHILSALVLFSSSANAYNFYMSAEGSRNVSNFTSEDYTLSNVKVSTNDQVLGASLGIHFLNYLGVEAGYKNLNNIHLSTDVDINQNPLPAPVGETIRYNGYNLLAKANMPFGLISQVYVKAGVIYLNPVIQIDGATAPPWQIPRSFDNNNIRPLYAVGYDINFLPYLGVGILANHIQHGSNLPRDITTAGLQVTWSG